MKILVQKYGGSSVADVARIGRVADRVITAQREGYAVCVVVSAMGKTTDQLLALVHEVSPEPPRRELDMLLTTGERVTMALLATALQRRGVDALSFTGSQSGILTNDRHFDARIIEVRPFRIEDELARGRVVIVAGYQGMSYRREITTLGRGGSDTTAVALAAALRAERCEIYSDVDGVYTADPRVVSAPKHIAEMNYEELQEMAEAGAKVLNAEAVEFARRHGIAIFARKTDDPTPASGGARETVVRLGVPREAAGVRAVVGEKNIALAHAAATEPGLLERVLAAADACEVPVKELASGADSSGEERLRFCVPLGRVPDWARGKAALLEASRGALSLDETRGVVSLVGDGITRDVRVLRRALACATRTEAPVDAVLTTPFRVSITTQRARVDELTRALHAEFVEDASVPVALETEG